MKDYLTKKEFADYSRKSVATIDKLIASNKIHMEENGLIASSQLSMFYLDNLLSHSKDNVLVLYVGDEDVSCLNEEQKAALGVSQKKKMDSSCGLVIEIAAIQESCAVGSSQKILLEFKKSILDEFIKRYNNGVSRVIQAFISSVTNDTEQYKEIAQLPIIVVADMIRYGTVKSIDGYNDSDLDKYDEMIDKVLTKVSKKDGMEYKTTDIDSLFYKIITDLRLGDGYSSTLFKRDDLTPDFFKKTGDLYDGIINDSDLDNKLMEAVKNSKRLETLWNKSVLKVISAETKMGVARLLSNGIYTVKNIKSGKIDCRSRMILKNDISEGYYQTVYFVGGNMNGADEILADEIMTAKALKKIKVKYVKFDDWES